METKNNSGAIFKNDKKTTDKHPDYNGTIVVDGVEKRIALWVKESAKGTKYFSAAISEPYQKDVQTEAKGVSQSSNDMPF